MKFLCGFAVCVFLFTICEKSWAKLSDEDYTVFYRSVNVLVVDFREGVKDPERTKTAADRFLTLASLFSGLDETDDADFEMHKAMADVLDSMPLSVFAYLVDQGKAEAVVNACRSFLKADPSHTKTVGKVLAFFSRTFPGPISEELEKLLPIHIEMILSGTDTGHSWIFGDKTQIALSEPSQLLVAYLLRSVALREPIPYISDEADRYRRFMKLLALLEKLPKVSPLALSILIPVLQADKGRDWQSFQEEVFSLLERQMLLHRNTVEFRGMVETLRKLRNNSRVPWKLSNYFKKSTRLCAYHCNELLVNACEVSGLRW